MVAIPILAAVGASTGWATGIVLAQAPARRLGAFEFTRIQLVACAAIVSLLCSVLGLWPSVTWEHWPAFVASTVVGIFLGNLAMIECLRLGGPRRTELLLSFKGPLVALMAFVWLGERVSVMDMVGALVVLASVMVTIQFGGDARSESDRLRGSLWRVVLLGLVATACQGLGFLLMKPAMLAGTDPLAASSVRLLGAAFLISCVALWPARVFRSDAEMTPGLLGRVVLPGVIGYVVSSSLLLYAFAHFHAGLAAVFGSLSPVLVLPILWLKDGRPPKPAAVLGAIGAIVGAGIVVLF
ncbi:DMT family transporter [Pelagimonas sp. KU-00592-HH]|uniref:DMT family transporter n=1 Tax=Pelagimonas sp. KU-00592-HH TaxID=3127651 RepID=UPI0031058DF3